ncbi:uncharacterized protein LOC141905981 isoform X2 [Tubulanus polymorphus]|uniref:uncharacterized protein LOC141905981 isoform X2 n=1 Tax=Tubulanus polymorphus TaxID=672921 RepID=UPI003DA58025
MAEPRRVELTSNVPLDGKKKPEKCPPVLRFELDIGESDDKTFAEFSYLELLKDAVDNDDEKLKEMDPFAAQDLAEQRKLEELAKSFEQKYGHKAKKKHMRKSKIGRLQDMIDLGDGYDDTDPFVDNTEAYDEVVPLSLTTKLGGFYINSGVLDFRQISDDSGDDDDFISSSTMVKKKRKRIKKITSDSESENDSKVVKKPVNNNNSSNLVSDKKKKKLVNNADGQHPKKKVKIAKPLLKTTSGDSLKKSTSIVPKSNPANKVNGVSSSGGGVSAAAPTASSSHNKKSSSESSGSESSESSDSSSSSEESDVDSDVNKSVTTQQQQQTQPSSAKLTKLDSTIESVVNSAVLSKSVKTVSSSDSPQKSSKTVLNPVKQPSINDSTGKDFDDSTLINPANAAKLPDDMSEYLVDKIDRIKHAAIESAAQGKCKFFTPSVNKLLHGIYKDCRQNLSCGNRSTVFSHLAAFLPCSKDTLLKRAKKLLLLEQDNKLKEPVDKLRDEINQMMPAILEKYNTDCQATNLLRLQAGEKPKEKEDSDSEGENVEKPATGERPKQIRGPRRKFIWTDKVRKLLCDVVSNSMGMFVISKSRGQTAEEYLKQYLESEIVCLWPKGWMNTRSLYKESRSVHTPYTNPAALAKQPKKLKVSDKADISTSLASMAPLHVPEKKKAQPKPPVVYPYMLPDSKPKHPVMKPIPTPPSTPKPPTIRLSTGNKVKHDGVDMKFINNLFDPSAEFQEIDMKDAAELEGGIDAAEAALIDLIQDAPDLLMPDIDMSSSTTTKHLNDKPPSLGNKKTTTTKSETNSSYAKYSSSGHSKSGDMNANQSHSNTGRHGQQFASTVRPQHNNSIVANSSAVERNSNVNNKQSSVANNSFMSPYFNSSAPSSGNKTSPVKDKSPQHHHHHQQQQQQHSDWLTHIDTQTSLANQQQRSAASALLEVTANYAKQQQNLMQSPKRAHTGPLSPPFIGSSPPHVKQQQQQQTSPKTGYISPQQQQQQRMHLSQGQTQQHNIATGGPTRQTQNIKSSIQQQTTTTEISNPFSALNRSGRPANKISETVGDDFNELLRNIANSAPSSTMTSSAGNNSTVTYSPRAANDLVPDFSHQRLLQQNKLLQQQSVATPHLLHAMLMNQSAYPQQSTPPSSSSSSWRNMSPPSGVPNLSRSYHLDMSAAVKDNQTHNLMNQHRQISPTNLPSVGMYSPTHSPMAHTPISPQDKKK